MSTSDDSLAAWAQARLANVYEYAPDTEAQNLVSNFDTALSPRAEIFLNDKPVEYDEYRKDMTERKAMANRAKVEFKDVIEVLDENKRVSVRLYLPDHGMLTGRSADRTRSRHHRRDQAVQA